LIRDDPGEDFVSRLPEVTRVEVQRRIDAFERARRVDEGTRRAPRAPRARSRNAE
jgi:hypothetical protein